MCGIVGYVGPSDCSGILLDGLKRLEYRGYDSAGMAVLQDGGIEVRRASGKLSMLDALLREQPLSGNVGIGHTRWATHGRPSEENAHPHRAGNVVVVHNGIIENYMELRSILMKAGREFTSETDTEVLSHLVDEAMKGGEGVLDATRDALKRVRGSYSIAVFSLDEPDRIIIAKNSSPLIVALGEGQNMVASDIPAMLGFSSEIITLDDGDVGVVTASECRIFALEDGRPIDKQPIHINLTPAMAEKGGYKHFMLKEINEQPRAMIDTMRGRISMERGAVLFETEGPDGDFLAGIQRVHLAACGTSWHAALVARNYLTRLARVPVEVHLAGEFDARSALTGPHDLFVTISQSGETLDTLRTHREAREAGMATLAVCNSVASSLAM